MSWKVRVYINGFGEVRVKVPRKHTKAEYADAVASAVTQTLQLVYPNPGLRFHPVLGEGGYDWDHEAQRAVVSETLPPSVEVGRRKGLRVYLRGLRDRLLRKEGRLREGVDS